MADMPDPAVAAAAATAFLEAHHYQGGLRITPLGVSARPAWAPPGERVGFRDEFPLAAGDWAVEFYRLLHEGRRVTWIGLFKRSVDLSFGDRSNHAGVGLWLVDQHLAEAETLLNALATFAGPIETEIGNSAYAAQAQDFVSKFLPGYLVASDRLPEPLSGWPHLPPEQALTQTYVAARGDRGFAEAAAQVAAASFLPGPSEVHSRAVILVTDRPDAISPELRVKPERVRTDIIPALLRRLPEAMDQANGRAASMSREIAGLREAAAAAEAAIAQGAARERETLGRAEAAEAANVELGRRIEMSDQLKLIHRVCHDLDQIKSQTGTLGAQLSGIERAMRQPASSPPETPRPAPQPRSYAPAPYQPQTRGERRPPAKPWLLYGAVAGLVIAAVLVTVLAFTMPELFRG
jgi:hypothetical protein